MARVYLEGSISKFGTEFPVKEGMSVANIFKLISAQVEGFRNHLIEAAESGIEFTIQHGKDFLGEEDLLLNLAKDDIIITELPAGAKGGGGKILAAIAIAAAVYFTGGAILAAGPVTAGTQTALGAVQLIGYGIATNLAITGLTELIAPGPEVDSADTNQASLFNGPINSVRQGQAIPIAYGEMIVGGTPISASYSSEPIQPSFLTVSPTASLSNNPQSSPPSTTVYNGVPVFTSVIAAGGFSFGTQLGFNFEFDLRGSL
jgi:predicted phage tail protein